MNFDKEIKEYRDAVEKLIEASGIVVNNYENSLKKFGEAIRGVEKFNRDFALFERKQTKDLARKSNSIPSSFEPENEPIDMLINELRGK